jgi:hypothetical protein
MALPADHIQFIRRSITMNPHSPTKQRGGSLRPDNEARPASGRTQPADLQAEDAGTAASGNDPATPGEPPLEQAGPQEIRATKRTGPDTQETP